MGESARLAAILGFLETSDRFKDEVVQPLWEGWETERQQFAAPALLRDEVTNALYRARKGGLISASLWRLALSAALSLPIHLHGEAALHPQALDFAERFALPAAYDAHYLALAEQLGAAFWTADRRLAGAVGSILPWIHLAGE